MVNVALVTYLEAPELSASDACLAAALNDRGHAAHAVPWDAPTDWTAFDSVVVRSTWDYHRRPAEFRAWLEHIEERGASVWNRPSVMRWNMHKGYLLDLERVGSRVVPTELVPMGASEPVTSIAARRNWGAVVVKPATGASALGVTALRADEFEAAEEWFRGQSREKDLLVQPSMSEIANGEWSMVFFGGEYSHAALKVPAPGDIRVQQRYGGTTTIFSPPPRLIDQAAEVLTAASSICQCVPSDFLYARVDGVVLESTEFMLMELELIEPGLFLHLSGAEGSAGRFGDAILKRV